jgi:predicted histidine transporter YuiF (NhaC family)
LGNLFLGTLLYQKTKPNKTKQNKTKQNKTKQNKKIKKKKKKKHLPVPALCTFTLHRLNTSSVVPCVTAVEEMF